VINRLYKEYDDRRVKGVLFNPGGQSILLPCIAPRTFHLISALAYTCGYRALNQAIGQVNGEGKIIPIVTAFAFFISIALFRGEYCFE